MPYTDVNLQGLSPKNSPAQNRVLLQAALDHGGTVIVSEPGTYDIDGTLFIGSYTTLEFANGAALRKVAAPDGFAQTILNKGALTKTFDEHIILRGVKILVNQVAGKTHVPGLRGQLGFYCVRDLRLDDIRIPDMEPSFFGIHVCTFEDIIITNCIISGKKDGIHLGRGKRFYISDCVFDTFDDAIALNAHDYDTSNPQLGFIEDGVIERCYDLSPERTDGYFCRFCAGAWGDWYEGMKVQKSDSVVSDGKIYRVFANPDGVEYTSITRPTHSSGHAVLDGINWVMVQEEALYEAAVRNVTVRDVTLYKPRTAFALHLDTDRWSRSYYPGAVIPSHRQLIFENVRVMHEGGNDLITVETPIDAITLQNCSLRANPIRFENPAKIPDLGCTRLYLSNCSSSGTNREISIINQVPEKKVELITAEKCV